MTSSDIADILYGVCRDTFAMRTARWGAIPRGRLAGERCVVTARRLEGDGTWWRRCTAQINLLVPDTPDGMADLARLSDLERIAAELRGTGVYEGLRYTWEVASTGTEEEPQMEAHFVNATVIFKVLNVKQ